MKEKETKRIKAFGKPEDGVTANEINRRLNAMSKVGEFKCETEQHRKARHALVRNIERYESAVNQIKKMLEEPSDEMKEYNKRKVELLQDCGAEEEHHPDVGTYYSAHTVDNEEDYKWQKKALDDEFAEALEEDKKRRERNDALGEYIVEDVPKPYMTKLEYFPGDITPRQLASIAFMLVDEGQEIPNSKKKNKKE